MRFWIKTKKNACGNRPAGGENFGYFLPKKKAPAASRQLEENCVFPVKTVFFQKNKVSFSGAIFPPKVFPENYKNKEAAAAAKRPMAAKRPWRQRGHGREAAMAEK